MLEANDVTQPQRLWLAYLATRRDIYAIPAANCYGYATNKREEARRVDPNRDFPYSRQVRLVLLSSCAGQTRPRCLQSFAHALGCFALRPAGR